MQNVFYFVIYFTIKLNKSKSKRSCVIAWEPSIKYIQWIVMNVRRNIKYFLYLGWFSEFLDKLNNVLNFLNLKIWDSDDEKLVVGITVKYFFTFIGLFSLSSKIKTSKIIQAKDANFSKIQICNFFCVSFWKYILIIIKSLPPKSTKFTF